MSSVTLFVVVHHAVSSDISVSKYLQGQLNNLCGQPDINLTALGLLSIYRNYDKSFITVLHI